ncbi:hypothetical protein [Halorientalis litorea]|jgi:hypothetical protein|uniref:hypothetical protein n=1 Tax=Halorientalis litorea TaxID=2931977 RepID=UPI001FF19669|nr:hypothetical protein [Halorientalis litorea]
MDINRRNVLLGLGTVGMGVGGAFGSGAFTAVEAERTVEINTTDDASAILTFAANSPAGDNIIATESVGGSSIIKVKQSNLNEQATTRFEDALAVTNGGGQNVGLSVDPSQSDDPNNLIGSVLDIQDTNGNTIVDGGTPGDNAVDVDSTTSVDLTIEVDLRNGNSGSAIDTINTIVFAAREGDHSSA